MMSDPVDSTNANQAVIISANTSEVSPSNGSQVRPNAEAPKATSSVVDPPLGDPSADSSATGSKQIDSTSATAESEHDTSSVKRAGAPLAGNPTAKSTSDESSAEPALDTKSDSSGSNGASAPASAPATDGAVDPLAGGSNGSDVAQAIANIAAIEVTTAAAAAAAAAAATGETAASNDSNGGVARTAEEGKKEESAATEDTEAMAAALIKAANAAAAEVGASSNGAAQAKEDGTTADAGQGEQPKRKRVRRGGWDTPTEAASTPAAGWGGAPQAAAPATPMTPLQELQRKLAEEQVAAAMGQAPAVTSVSAGAAALGRAMGAGGVAGPDVQNALPVVADNPRRIYVGSLHYDLRENDVAAIFRAFGPIKTVDMPQDPATGHHKGFGFVEFMDERGANAALSTMNGFELAGRPIKVGRPHGGGSGPADGLSAALALAGMATFMAQRTGAVPGQGPGSTAAEQLKAAMTMNTTPPQTKVYVGNVEQHITTEMIRTVFEPFGMVVGAEMVADPSKPGSHKGFGFIQYAQESVAKTVLETMNGFELAGRSLKVAWAQDQSKPALSVLPPGLNAAGAAAQAAAMAAKVAASTAGGAAAAAAAARLTTADHIHAALGTGVGGMGGIGGMAGMGGMGPMGGMGGPGPMGGVGPGMGGGMGAGPQAASAANAQALAAAQRAELMRRMSEGRMQGAMATGGGMVRMSRCLCLMNMLMPADVKDRDTKAEILDEMATCGLVEQFVVHQQRASGGTVVAVRVFVVYSNPNEAAIAVRKMHGRFFAGRQVHAALYDFTMFSRGILDA